MNNIKKLCLFSFCLSLLVALCFSYSFTSAQVDSSIVSVPINAEVYVGPQPYVTGQTAVNTEVMVYFDDNFAGLAVNSDTSDAKVKTFYYSYSSHLMPGAHKVTLVARNKITLNKSATLRVKDIIIPILPAPTIFEPNGKTIITSLKPRIQGATWSGTYVYVFVDDLFKYKSAFLVSDFGTAQFNYQVSDNLSYGWHTTYAYSENSSGDKSLISNVINFRVESEMVAPTLQSAFLSNTKLKIEGVTPSDTSVNIYIDNILAGNFQTYYNASGVTGFTQTIKTKLNKGRHVVCLTAIDSRGKVSNCSNNLAFYISVPTITTEAAVEVSESESNKLKSQDSDRDGLNDYDELYIYKTNSKKVDTDGDGYSDKKEIDNGYSPLISAIKDPKHLDKLEKTDSDLDGISDYLEIYKYKTNPTNADTDSDGYDDRTELTNGYNPLVPTSKDKKKVVSAAIVAQLAKTEVDKLEQIVAKDDTEVNKAENIGEGSSTIESGEINIKGTSTKGVGTVAKKVNYNLIIFIVFIVGIVLWIVWVNRELIKERAKQNREKTAKEENQEDQQK